MIIDSSFRPARWLSNPHLQTLWPLAFRRRPTLPQRDERIELSDGDFLDIAWIGDKQGPLVLVVHGLEGSIRSHYACSLLDELLGAGYRPVFMHLRGCSGEPNRLDCSYHSGKTEDLAAVVEHVESATGERLSAVIGFSLGGNLLLKWLGETANRNRLSTAVAVSVPFLLGDCANRLEQGWSRLYRNHLVNKLRSAYRRRFSTRPSPLDCDVGTLRSFYDFDDQVTAPLNGFSGADHYYAEASSRSYLKSITVPTLIVHARDDPFMWPSTIPDAHELSDSITLELASHGGHVGFVSEPTPWQARYWLNGRILQHLQSVIAPAI